MSKTSKILIAVCLVGIALVLANFAMAAGKGYFLEKDNQFFIFDNLFVNGYMAIEALISQRQAIGRPGDVLVGRNVILDSGSDFNFCTDSPLNTDCSSKNLIWKPDSLVAENTGLYQLQTNSVVLTPGNNLIFDAYNPVTTDNGVKITGCFSNDGSGNCASGELKTANLYLESLGSLSGGSIILNPSSLTFGNIKINDINKQNLCWRINTNFSCSGSASALKGAISYSNVGVVDSVGYSLCCNLNITY